jgi:carboxyl-terminal processing protease
MPAAAAAKPSDTYKSLENFSNVLSIVQKNYVEEVSPSELIEGSIKGMLSSLDPHSSYMKPEDFKELKLETKGSFTGIGVEITIRDNFLTVVSPIEGTPGYRVGLKAGDRIVKINGKSTKNMGLMEAVHKLRGPKGTKVTISVFRKGWRELKKITITRDVIPLHSVKWKILEPGYAYIRITNFQAKTTRDFKEALKKITAKGTIRGLVIDLRNNPGGLLAQAVRIADIFIDKGVIVSTRGRVKDQNTVYRARSGGIKHSFPIVVLVNEGSASASEIVAGALQDHRKAIIMGTKTFGKGSVQTIIPMANGAGLRLTTARYYTPSGRSIQAKGITPDVVVERIEPAKKVKHDVLREADLEHHMKNEDIPEREKPSKTLKEQEEARKKAIEKEEKEIRKMLERDNQLRSALMMLKGLNVYRYGRPVELKKPE